MLSIAPWWLPTGHMQTIWPVLASAAIGMAGSTAVRYRRQRCTTPDGDFIDLDWLDVPPSDTLLVLFHGLEGTSNSHYALAFAEYAQGQAWNYVVPHFRGCSGEINLAARAYHSGDFEEIDWILQTLREQHTRQILVVGVSLGGNALLRWAQEAGSQAGRLVSALASISAPVDLTASGLAMGQGFNRQVYTRRFLATMKPKALEKLQQFPGLFDAQALHAAQDLYAFDDVFTAPLHGFNSAELYWKQASAKPHLAQIRVPSLVVNALNDPFVPANSLPDSTSVGQFVSLWQPDNGGHVGFTQAGSAGQLCTLPHIIGDWLMRGEPDHG